MHGLGYLVHELITLWIFFDQKVEDQGKSEAQNTDDEGIRNQVDDGH